MLNPEVLNELVRRRRAVFPQAYNDQKIPREIIGQILENANWAPTHKRTEPWRFRVFTGAALEQLGDYLADFYKNNTAPESFSEMKYSKNRSNAVKSACIIAICMQRDPQAGLPEFEEIAAVSCAVQNMWLSCTAYGIGAYWSTPRAILEARDFLGLQENERCLGLFYMGYTDAPEVEGKRNPVGEKVRWM